MESFKLEWVVTGKVKSVAGRIEVIMNWDTKRVDGTHAATHDDYVKHVPTHKINGFVDGKVWWTKLDLESEMLVLSEVERCKKQMYEEMERISNADPVVTFADKMAALGFSK